MIISDNAYYVTEQINKFKELLNKHINIKKHPILNAFNRISLRDLDTLWS